MKHHGYGEESSISKMDNMTVIHHDKCEKCIARIYLVYLLDLVWMEGTRMKGNE